MIYFDGHYYESREDCPDLGSFAASGSGTLRNYRGMSADIAKLQAAVKLPQYADLETGSGATCIDTGEIYKYSQSTREFYKWG